MRTPIKSFRSGSIRIREAVSYQSLGGASIERSLAGEPKTMRRAADTRGADGWSVYLLRCADGTLYTGATNDVERRLDAHARGEVKYTRGRLPVALAWIER